MKKSSTILACVLFAAGCASQPPSGAGRAVASADLVASGSYSFTMPKHPAKNHHAAPVAKSVDVSCSSASNSEFSFAANLSNNPDSAAPIGESCSGHATFQSSDNEASFAINNKYTAHPFHLDISTLIYPGKSDFKLDGDSDEYEPDDLWQPRFSIGAGLVDGNQRPRVKILKDNAEGVIAEFSNLTAIALKKGQKAGAASARGSSSWEIFHEVTCVVTSRY